MEIPPLVRRGVSCFNRGLFYECHEYLEDAWRDEPGEIRCLYQGILQIGVGLYHLENGNWRGSVALIRRGLGRLENLSPAARRHYGGLDLPRLERECGICLDELDRLGPERAGILDPALIPHVYDPYGKLL